MVLKPTQPMGDIDITRYQVFGMPKQEQAALSTNTYHRR